MGRWLEQLMVAIFTVVMSVLVVTLFAQVVTRYVLPVPWPWTQEVTRITFIVLVFLGGVVASARDAHLRIDALTKRLRGDSRRLVSVVVQLLLASLFLVIFYQGIELVRVSGSQLTPTLLIPMSYVYMILPVSGAFWLAIAARDLWRSLRS